MMTILRELKCRMGLLDEKGQTLVEYALIIGLVVLAVILVLGLLGDQIETIFTNITDTLEGVVPAPAA